MRELRTGLWHWEAQHPDWPGPENEALRQRLAGTAETPSRVGMVSSYAIDHGDQLLLFDPLAVPKEIVERAADRLPLRVEDAGLERDVDARLHGFTPRLRATRAAGSRAVSGSKGRPLRSSKISM